MKYPSILQYHIVKVHFYNKFTSFSVTELIVSSHINMDP